MLYNKAGNYFGFPVVEVSKMAANFGRGLTKYRTVFYTTPRLTGFRCPKPFQDIKIRVAVYSSSSSAEDTVFLRARNHSERIALRDDTGNSFTYQSILNLSGLLGRHLTSKCNTELLKGQRIAFLCQKDVNYVAVQWAIWRHGGIAVPLSESHPNSLLEYFISDSQSTLLVSTQLYSQKISSLVDKLGIPYVEIPNVQPTVIPVDDLTLTEKTTESWEEMGAIIFYTSGTTGKPKGVLTTHGNIRAQVLGMVDAWKWTNDDCILHVLPLNHVHGVINVLCCPLWVGATCIMLKDFQPDKVWQYLQSSTLSLFMAVPTIYSKLIQYYQEKNHSMDQKQLIVERCSELRLMVSGSSALPEPTMAKWKQISGHTLLERYGMTEIGMALSNPLKGSRIPGSVGRPLPKVRVRIVAKDDSDQECDGQVLVEGDEHQTKVYCEPGKTQGALQVKGPSVFKRYWGKPESTQKSFTSDGWFRTGDDAEYIDGVYKIMGRASVDIIKNGGYKISALDIERELLAHPSIKDVAVLGVPDDIWGQRVAAIVSLQPQKELRLDDINLWSKDRLSKYQTPTLLSIVEEIPRNAMGKVNKKQLVELFNDKQ